MIYFIYQLIRTARPRQWFKNMSLFAAPLFAGTLFNNEVFQNSIEAFIAFSALSSGGYFVNDIVDADKDRLHPIKRNRPIASGKVGVKTAWFIAFSLIIGSIVYAYFALGSYATMAMMSYILVQFSYSLYFRNIIILDSLIVATLFVIRVFTGGLASNTSISSWLALTTIGISLLLAFGKRRSEKTIVARILGVAEEIKTRQTLKHYPDTLLDAMISMSATYTIITYSLFTFQISPQAASEIISPLLPSILRNPKWMMLTIPFVIYGVARYLYIIYEKHEGESPERILLKDMPLLLTVISWGLTVLAVIYLLPYLS